MSRLQARGLAVAYDAVEVVHELSLKLPRARITAIVGPNASGKSTSLRALARLLRPSAGVVCLDGADIHQLPTRQVAAKVGILPRSPQAPSGLVVQDLVARGRYAHRGWLRQWSTADAAAVEEALAATGMTGLAARPVETLSGGQRQRARIAMALAQQSDILLLDEPTTFLDLAHLDLLAELSERAGRTVVLVLHHINQACRYADHLVALADGVIVASGPPSSVITADLVEQMFGLDCVTIPDPATGTPPCVPAARRRSSFLDGGLVAPDSSVVPPSERPV